MEFVVSARVFDYVVVGKMCEAYLSSMPQWFRDRVEQNTLVLIGTSNRSILEMESSLPHPRKKVVGFTWGANAQGACVNVFSTLLAEVISGDPTFNDIFNALSGPTIDRRMSREFQMKNLYGYLVAYYLKLRNLTDDKVRFAVCQKIATAFEEAIKIKKNEEVVSTEEPNNTASVILI